MREPTPRAFATNFSDATRQVMIPRALRGVGRETRARALLRRRVKNSVFWQTPKKQLLKCERRARRERAAASRRARALVITQQIVLGKAMNIGRDAAHPHTRVHAPCVHKHAHTVYTHTRSTHRARIHTRTHARTRTHAVSARI